MQELIHIFVYLKKHLNSGMVLDPSETDFDMKYFQRQDWIYSIYSSTGELIKEVLPSNMPHPLGNGFKILFSWTMIIMESPLLSGRGPASLAC